MPEIDEAAEKPREVRGGTGLLLEPTIQYGFCFNCRHGQQGHASWPGLIADQCLTPGCTCDQFEGSENRPGYKQAPPVGALTKCLVCALDKPWGIFDGDTGASVCVECRDKARAHQSLTEDRIRRVSDVAQAVDDWLTTEPEFRRGEPLADALARLQPGDLAGDTEEKA